MLRVRPWLDCLGASHYALLDSLFVKCASMMRLDFIRVGLTFFIYLLLCIYNIFIIFNNCHACIRGIAIPLFGCF